jgi:hypothetical protein
MIFVYVWKKYRANISGAVVRRVTCEKCSCAYAYEMVRSARGAGTSAYLLNNAGAEDRARTQANKRLRRELQRGIDPVGCPDCGWYQADMVREARRRKLHAIVPTAIVCLALAGAYALVVGAVMSMTSGIQPWPATVWLRAGVLPGGLAGVGLLALAIRHAVMRGVNPNRGFPDRPAAYPGAPIGHKVEAAVRGQATHPRSVQEAAAVGAYPAPPPRALKASSKTPRRAPGAE